MYIVHVAHLAEDYSDGNPCVVRLIVWFTRIPVRVTFAAVNAVRRFASWLAVKTRVD
jgi:hypothetical protein